jgi:hypothetical protein
MRNRLFAALLITCSLFCFSCTKEKDETARPENAYIGKWKLEKIEYSYSWDWNADGILDAPFDETEPGGANDYLMFDKDGKFTVFTEGDEDKGKWQLEGSNKLLIHYDGDDDPYSFNIKEKTSNKMVLYSVVMDASSKDEETIYLVR